MTLWLTLVGAALEVMVLYSRRLSDPVPGFDRAFVWMAPLGLTLLSLTINRIFSAASLIGMQSAGAAGLGAAAAVVFANLAFLTGGLHHYAGATLAVGLGVQVARLVYRRPERMLWLLRRSAVGLAVFYSLVVPALWLSLARETPETSQASGSPDSRPNVLLITLDTVRAANMSLYGYSRDTTPEIARHATRGVVFDAAFATAPWTLPSHATMFTGRWPHELSTGYRSALDGAFPTLAEHLAGRGYSTAAFVANLIYCTASSGLSRGFEHFEDYPRSAGRILTNSTLLSTVSSNLRVRRLFRNDQDLVRVSAADINNRALTWLDNAQDRPFFLFLNYFDAHQPYFAPEPFDRSFGPGRIEPFRSDLNHWIARPGPALRLTALQEEVDAYDGTIRYIDWHVGRLLDEFAARGLVNDTVIVITSDHGEEFGEHDRLYGHGDSLYRAGLHVPLVITAPEGMDPGRSARVVSLRDLPATIADLVGSGADSPFPGISLASWSEPDHAVSPTLSVLQKAPNQPDWFPSNKGDMTSLVGGGFHYIRNGDGSEELYDLKDLREAVNQVQNTAQSGLLSELRSVVNALTGTRPSGLLPRR